MKLSQFYDNLSRGGEIEFRYNGKNYSITQPEKISVMEAYNYKTYQIYDNVEDVGNYLVEGKQLKDIIEEIEITFSCFE